MLSLPQRSRPNGVFCSGGLEEQGRRKEGTGAGEKGEGSRMVEPRRAPAHNSPHETRSSHEERRSYLLWN